MVELNAFLQPIKSFFSNSKFTDGYSFDAQNERGAVTGMFIRDASITNAKIGTAAIGTANIGTLTFNEISGGTATLGGTANGNGLVEVLNDSSGTVVTINKDGIAVTDGSISVKNTSGSTVFDSSGLVSATNFTFNTDTGSSNGTTTSTSFVDVPGVTTSVVLSRPSKVLLLATVSGRIEGDPSDSTARFASFQINIGGTLTGPVINTTGAFFGTSSGYTLINETTSTHSIVDVGAGTTTFKLQYKTNNGSYAAVVVGTNTQISYLVLGT